MAHNETHGSVPRLAKRAKSTMPPCFSLPAHHLQQIQESQQNVPMAKVLIKCENCMEKNLERTETEEGFAWVCPRFKK
jgi:hypothetical protein